MIMIEDMFAKSFEGGDSVIIFDVSAAKLKKYGNALHRDTDVVYFSNCKPRSVHLCVCFFRIPLILIGCYHLKLIVYKPKSLPLNGCVKKLGCKCLEIRK